MPESRLIHPDIYKRLGRLVVFSAAVFLFVLAFAGSQECRGGRAILASDYGPQVFAKVELVGRERVLVWDGYLTFTPGWIDSIFGTYYTVTDWMTCLM